jgi:hypothetical protein
MLQPEFLQQLVTFAKRQQDNEAKGTADSDAYASLFADFSADGRERLDRFATAVAEAANVPKEVAANAVICMLAHKLTTYTLEGGRIDGTNVGREKFVDYLRAGRTTAN